MEYRNVLLISEDYIKSESNLDNNVSGKYLQSAIKLAQDISLQSTIGTKLLESLQKKCIDTEDNIDKEENIKYKELLDYYIQPFLLYQVLSDIIIPITYKLSNFGVMRTDDEKDIVAEPTQVNLLKKYYQDKADFFKTRLQNWVITYYNDFPELYRYKPLKDLYPNLYSASSCSIWLGGVRSKGLYNNSLRSRYDFPSSNKNKKK